MTEAKREVWVVEAPECEGRIPVHSSIRMADAFACKRAGEKLSRYVPEPSEQGWVDPASIVALANKFWELSEGEGQAGNVSRESLWLEAEKLTRALLPSPPKAGQ